MLSLTNVLFASVLVLPSAMGLTLNTPTGAAAEGTVLVTWSTVATDPKFSLLLVDQQNKETFDVAQGIAPTALNTTVALGAVPPGTYTLQAVEADSINTFLSATGTFTVSAAGAAGAGTAATGAAVAANNAGAATGKAAGKTGKGKGGKAAGAKAAGGANAAAAKAAAAKAAAAKAAGAKATAAAATAKAAKPAKGAKAAKGKGFGGRSVVSAKFGRRELYRD
ncbi:hypothetical protein DFH09DRAFT_1406108 [Mycena vulgaris]|nr:hypothetical protein DFH09DRAFT_1406108 [Mycena vulgaris]